MAARIAPGALTVEGVVEADRRAARVDDRFLRRLAVTLRSAFVDVNGDGTPLIKDVFHRLDRSINEDNFEADVWRFKALLHGPTGICDKDLELFFTELYEYTSAAIEPSPTDDDDARRVDMAEAMVYIRRVFGHPTSQFHTIIKKARAKRPDFSSSPFNSEAQPSRLVVYEYLTGPPLLLSQSEAFWVLEQCEADDRARSIDVDYLVSCLFAFPLPDDVAYPLLLNKLVECVADRHREHCGITGVRRVLKRVLAGVAGAPSLMSAAGQSPLPPSRAASAAAHQKEQQQSAIAANGASPTPRRTHGRFANPVGGAPGAGEPSQQQQQQLQAAALLSDPGLVDGSIDRGAFRSFCLTFGCGLSATEADVLFQFIADPATEAIGAEAFVELVADRIPVASRHELVRIAAEVRRCVVGRNPGGLCDLHVALAAIANAADGSAATAASSEPSPLPLGQYAAALRRCGVSPDTVPDIDVEHLHREAPTCVALVLLLQGTLPPSRELVVRKLFSRFDADSTGLVSRARVFECFEPSKADAKVCTRAAERKEALAQYLATLPSRDPNITYAEFLYFWANVSASITDDAPFVMLLWQAFGMQRDGSKMVPQSASRRRSLQQQQLQPGTGATSVASAGASPTPPFAARQPPASSSDHHAVSFGSPTQANGADDEDPDVHNTSSNGRKSHHHQDGAASPTPAPVAVATTPNRFVPPVRTSVAINRAKIEPAVSTAVPMGDERSAPVSRRRAAPPW